MVIFSDFCCWVPIVIMKYLAVGGMKIPPQVSAWTAVFILPLNSSINPFLYTVATLKAKKETEKAKKEERVGKNSSIETNITQVSNSNQAQKNTSRHIPTHLDIPTC